MSDLKSYRRGIYRIVELAPSRAYAEILFDRCLQTTPYLFVGMISDVNIHVNTFFPNVREVRGTEFVSELDHIKLFRVRSDDPTWTGPPQVVERPHPLDSPVEPPNPWNLP